MSLALDAAVALPPTRHAPLRLTLETDLSALAEDWRALELRAAASPYQSLPFVSAWAAHVGVAEGIRPAVGMVRTAGGLLVAILPFAIKRRAMAKVGVYMGGAHANFSMPLMDLAFQRDLAPAAVEGLLRSYCRSSGVDALYLANQPITWRGENHPFLNVGTQQEAPSCGYLTDLPDDLNGFISRHLSTDRQRKDGRKQRRLQEAGCRFVGMSGEPVEQHTLLETFFRLKAMQFAAMGVPDPFAEPGATAFLEASLGGDANGHLRLLGLEQDGAIIAVAGGLRRGDQYTLMLLTFLADHDLAKHSPGEYLLVETIRQQHAEGVRTFDYGAGYAPYKDVWATQTLPLFDTALPHTVAGRAAAGVAGVKRGIVRAIKQRPKLFEITRRLRGELLRLGGR
jgi:CelD/BcsL family acetyltransferase involved in cellulose biosynthesis